MLLFLKTQWSTLLFKNEKRPKRPKKIGDKKINLKTTIKYIKIIIPFVALTAAIIELIKVIIM
jgi:hypothetical protein